MWLPEYHSSMMTQSLLSWNSLFLHLQMSHVDLVLPRDNQLHMAEHTLELCLAQDETLCVKDNPQMYLLMAFESGK